MQCIYPSCLFHISFFQKFLSLCHCPSTCFKHVSTGDAGLTCMNLSPITPSFADAISKGSGWFVVSGP